MHRNSFDAIHQIIQGTNKFDSNKKKLTNVNINYGNASLMYVYVCASESRLALIRHDI